MPREIPYSSVEEFFENEKPWAEAPGKRYYSYRQISLAMGLDSNYLNKKESRQMLKKNLGIDMDQFSWKFGARNYVSETCVRLIFDRYILNVVNSTVHSTV